MRANALLSRQPALRTACRQLMVVSLLGAVHHRTDDASLCDIAVESTLGNTNDFRLMRAVARGLGGDENPVAGLPDTLLSDDSDDDRTKVSVALAMLLAGNAEWKPIVDRVLALSTDIPAREAATFVVAELGNYTPRH